jgi:hypothetical protein
MYGMSPVVTAIFLDSAGIETIEGAEDVYTV